MIGLGMSQGVPGGIFDGSLEVETKPVLTAARELDALGLDALQKASLFGNVTALFAMKGGLDRDRYLRLCSELWELTRVQNELLGEPKATKGGVS